MSNINYSQVGDYQFPNLKMNEEVVQGKYALMKMEYMKNHQPAQLLALRMKNQLNKYLKQVQKEATQMVELLMKQMLQKTPAPNKENNQMEWVQFMNNLHNQAEEVVIRELINN